jgi:cell division protein FtsW
MVVHAPPLTQRAPARATTLRTPVANPLEGATIAVTTMLLALGVLCVATAVTPQAIGGSIYTFMLRYGVMAVVGLALFFAARKLDLTKWSWAIAPLLAVSLGLLVLVRVMGQASSGGQRWLAVGSFSFEPSELFTLVSCLYVATVVARAEQARAQWLDVLVRCSPVAVGAILILAEPDYGTGSVLLLVSFVVLVLAGMPRRLIVFLCAVAGFLLGLGAIMARYRMARVEALFHAGPAAASYQVIQAKIALGSGRISGLGLGQSRAKWGLLPNPHTDFIFAIVGEQFGFIGAVALLGLFLWLITLGMRAG